MTNTIGLLLCVFYISYGKSKKSLNNFFTGSSEGDEEGGDEEGGEGGEGEDDAGEGDDEEDEGGEEEEEDEGGEEEEEHADDFFLF